MFSPGKYERSTKVSTLSKTQVRADTIQAQAEEDCEDANPLANWPALAPRTGNQRIPHLTNTRRRANRREGKDSSQGDEEGT